MRFSRVDPAEPHRLRCPQASSSDIHRFGWRWLTALPHPHTPGVKPRHGVPEALLRLAALQAGLVTREQVLGHGLSRHVLQRLLDTGAWQPVARGLFVTGTVSPSWDGLAWGGLLLGGDRARLGPQASAYLHELVADAPSPIDVLVPLGRVVPNTWAMAVSP